MSTPKTSPARLIGADLIRVLAMFMVVCLHTVLNFTVRVDFFNTKAWFILEPIVALSKGAMLLFFMLSGYLVIKKNRTIKQNLNNLLQRIIIPLLFFELLNFVYDFYKFNLSSQNQTIFWQNKITNLPNVFDSPLWFLGVLLFMYLLNLIFDFYFFLISPFILFYQQ